MFFDKENSSRTSQTRSSSVNSNRTSSRQKSLIRIPSTSKIPSDFFRRSSVERKSHPSRPSVESSLEITFMPSQLKKSLSANSDLNKCQNLSMKPIFSSVKRVGKRTYERQNQMRASQFWNFFDIYLLLFPLFFLLIKVSFVEDLRSEKMISFYEIIQKCYLFYFGR